MSHQQRLIKYAPFLLQHIGDLRGREVLIIGDVGLDEYVLGQVRRISPEAPVPVVEVDTEESRLGLSANVAQNVASLGGVPKLISVVGRDAAADQLRSLLQAGGASPDLLVVDPARPTTRKLRVMVQNHHIVRVDYERRQFLSPQIEDELLRHVAKAMPTAASVVIEDYAKGAVSERLIKEVLKLARQHGKRVLADPHRSAPAATYRGVDLFKPNLEESYLLSGLPQDEHRKDPAHLERVGRRLMEIVGCSSLVVTCGKDGMRLFEGNNFVDLPTNAKEVFDVTGAGDTVIAALALGWGAGFSLEQACALANLAAGVVVAKIGCVPCEVSELIAAIEELQ
jgi:rfaE bifunctional protein kinase chain/domain